MNRALYATLDDRFGVRRERIGRREMLRRAFAATAGLLLSERFAFTAPRGSAPRVVVVGGGFAGLAAAYELSQAGADVTVLEARNRIGGRVISFHDLVPGGTMEGGAELIGSNHAMWIRYKERFGLLFMDLVEDDDLESPIVINGRRLTAGESEQLWKDMTAALSLLNADSARVGDPFEPWTTPDAASLDARSLGDWIQRVDASPLCKAGMEVQMTADNGVRTSWQSYLGNLAMIKGGGLDKYWTDTERYRCQGGNQQLAERLAAAIGAARIRLRAPVSAVAITDQGAQVSTAAGATHECDHVVLAVPPTLWNRIAFDPPLRMPSVPQMGANVKFLIGVKDRFWRRAHLAPTLLSDGPVHLTWQTTDVKQATGAGLVAFSGGAAADECRGWPPAERTGRYLAALAPVYRGIRASFVKARFMDWPSDPWLKGSYSFPAPGQVTTVGPFMQRPHAGRLHFAGEHTCYAFVGYMEGGLQSGVRAAARIAALTR